VGTAFRLTLCIEIKLDQWDENHIHVHIFSANF